jgi:hypothetical protein
VNPVNDEKPAFILSGGGENYHNRQDCGCLLTIKLFFSLLSFFSNFKSIKLEVMDCPKCRKSEYVKVGFVKNR